MADLVTLDTWRLVQLKPNCLQIAQRNLVRQGFQVFCPLEQTTKRRNGRFVSCTSPLFPGYLFLGCVSASAPFRVINSTYGVSRLVSFTDAPAEVPLEIVAALMARCDQLGVLKMPDPLHPGDEVRILSGPFADFVGKVESLGPQQRVWVLLDLLGGSTRVALKRDTIKPS